MKERDTYKFVEASNYISPSGAVVAVIDFLVNGRPRYYKAHHEGTKPVDLKNKFESGIRAWIRQGDLPDIGEGGSLLDYGWRKE